MHEHHIINISHAIKISWKYTYYYLILFHMNKLQLTHLFDLLNMYFYLFLLSQIILKWDLSDQKSLFALDHSVEVKYYIIDYEQFRFLDYTAKLCTRTFIQTYNSNIWEYPLPHTRASKCIVLNSTKWLFLPNISRSM